VRRRNSRQIKVGGIAIGGDAPISIQSMTNTKTSDVEATVAQIRRLEQLGCEIVRLAVPDILAAKAISAIKNQVSVPLIADIHFDYRLALVAIENGADGLRLNPGNIGSEEEVAAIVRAAKPKGIPIRVGVNAGSLEKQVLEKYGGHPTPEAMVESALGQVRLLEQMGFSDIKISLKANDVPLMIKAYKLMAAATDYPLHIGVTEAGPVRTGTIKSAVGIGALLADGIGDTIRVSLTGSPEEEVVVAKEILQTLNLRRFGPVIVSCPTCGRCMINLEKIVAEVEQRLTTVTQPLKVAVMGCVVNGPGEAREADVGIAGGNGQGLVFCRGQIVRKVNEDRLVEALFEEIKKLDQEACLR